MFCESELAIPFPPTPVVGGGGVWLYESTPHCSDVASTQWNGNTVLVKFN